MKEILPILIIAACPLSMLAMGAFAWFSGKFLAGRKKRASRSAAAEPPVQRS
jgi:hypothetical protein